jgi:ATPase subunit of ABC transporter with duplicated ATPase domains
LFTFDDVSFKYRDYIFRHYSDDISTDKIGIIGKNGVGKTTLLRLLDEQIYPKEGRIVVSGSTYMVDFDLGRYGAFHPDDLIDLCSRLASFNAARAPEIMSMLSLSDYSAIPIGELSQGVKKKVSLLLGFMSTADFLLVDEPFESIDPESSQAMVRWLRDRPGGLVVVSHDHALLAQCVDDVYEVARQRLEKPC